MIIKTNFKITLGFLLCFLVATISSAQDQTQNQNWKSGIELGTGLSITGYNATLAYTGTWKQNLVFIGPKIVYSDANALFDTPWGLHTGYRRYFPVSTRLKALAALEYQAVFFEYDELETSKLNSIQEFHFSYGLVFFINDKWSIGNTLSSGGYIERLIDPFDGRVDIIKGYSTQVRIYCGYHF